MFKVSRNVYLEDGRILDLREELEETAEKENDIIIQPSLTTEFDLEKDMFAPYPQQGIPYADSGSWIGQYNNGDFTNTTNNLGV